MTIIMGILNVTPDSFSDGGQFAQPDQALKQAEQMIQDGAEVIDVGGESTRPGAKEVSLAQELERVIPIIEALNQRFDVTLSVDSSKAMVMQEAIKAGASLVNDVRALQEEGALEVCAKSDVDICLMHMQGEPRSMQQEPQYNDVVAEVSQFFDARIAACEQAGIDRKRLILDPGFGFGKTLAHNLSLLRNINHFMAYKLPILAGLSRKRMIGTLLNDAPVDERVTGSVTAALYAIQQGAHIVRVHDVKQTADAIRIWQAINNK